MNNRTYPSTANAILILLFFFFLVFLCTENADNRISRYKCPLCALVQRSFNFVRSLYCCSDRQKQRGNWKKTTYWFFFIWLRVVVLVLLTGSARRRFESQFLHATKLNRSSMCVLCAFAIRTCAMWRSRFDYAFGWLRFIDAHPTSAKSIVQRQQKYARPSERANGKERFLTTGPHCAPSDMKCKNFWFLTHQSLFDLSCRVCVPFAAIQNSFEWRANEFLFLNWNRYCMRWSGVDDVRQTQNLIDINVNTFFFLFFDIANGIASKTPW